MGNAARGARVARDPDSLRGGLILVPAPDPDLERAGEYALAM